MTAWFDVRVDDPQRWIDTLGAGALLRWETSEDGSTWAERGTEVLVATKKLHTIEYPAGTDVTVFRSRFSKASPSTSADYSGYSDVRPISVSVITATAASASANSYLTVAAADVFAAEDYGPEPEKWLSLDARDKAAILKRATREIDAHVDPGWPPYDADQALVFPRDTIDVDGDGLPFIPRKVVLATYQQAIYIAKNKDALAAMNAHRSNGGNTDPDAAYGVDPAAGPSLISPMAMHYLAGFRIAPKSGKGGSIGSARVSSGFRGGW